MTDKREVRYEVEDGYVGSSRPQSFTIKDDWIEDYMNDDDLEFELSEMIQEDFQQRISWTYLNKEEVVEWAKTKRDELRQANEEKTK
jgi:hypothetical protein